MGFFQGIVLSLLLALIWESLNGIRNELKRLADNKDGKT
jgi:hypothetical protein